MIISATTTINNDVIWSGGRVSQDVVAFRLSVPNMASIYFLLCFFVVPFCFSIQVDTDLLNLINLTSSLCWLSRTKLNISCMNAAGWINIGFLYPFLFVCYFFIVWVSLKLLLHICCSHYMSAAPLCYLSEIMSWSYVPPPSGFFSPVGTCLVCLYLGMAVSTWTLCPNQTKYALITSPPRVCLHF